MKTVRTRVTHLGLIGVARNRERIRQDLPLAIEMLKQTLSEGTDRYSVVAQFEEFQRRNVESIWSVGEDRGFEQGAAEQVPSGIAFQLLNIQSEGTGKEFLENQIAGMLALLTEWHAKIPH